MVLDATAMDGLATAIGSAINTNQMVANLTTLIPVIGGVVLFAFTYRIVKKLITGASKGKARI